MKHLKTFNESQDYEYRETGKGYSVPVMNSSQFETAKDEMRKAFREDEKFNHLSDEDIVKVVDTFYKVQIKFGEIIIED